MSVGLYMDVHVPAAMTRGLLLRDVDVLTAQIDGTTELPDPDLLDRAMELRRVLFSQDEDLLAEATRRQRGGQHFGGVIYAHQLGITFGRAINAFGDSGSSRQPGGLCEPRGISAAGKGAVLIIDNDWLTGVGFVVGLSALSPRPILFQATAFAPSISRSHPSPHEPWRPA